MAVAKGNAVNSRAMSPRTSASQNQRLAYNIQEAADAVRVSPGLIRKMIRNGELQATHIGDRVIVPARSLEALLAQ